MNTTDKQIANIMEKNLTKREKLKIFKLKKRKKRLP